MSLKAFYKEALIWHQLDHPHILPLLGIIEDPSGFTISMVLPWMENGNVRQYLDKKVKEVRFQARYTLTIIQWVCENLCLHQANHLTKCLFCSRIAHRDHARPGISP